MNSFGSRFGALVKQRRGVEGLTQQALAVLAFHEEGSKARISELENGRVPNPQQRIVDAIVVALNLTDADLASCRKPSVPQLPDGFLAKIGMTDELVDALSWNFGFENPKASGEKYQQFLRDKADELSQLQARIGALGEANKRISNMMTAAQHEIEQGRFEKADDILGAAEELQQEEHTLTQIRKQANIRETRAEAALLKGDPEVALAHFQTAAGFFVAFDQIESARHFHKSGIQMFRHAEKFGSVSFKHAFHLVGEAESNEVEKLDRDFWIEVQNTLAVFNSHYAVSISESNTTQLLNESRIKFQTVLCYFEGTGDQSKIAKAKNNLALTIRYLVSESPHEKNEVGLADLTEAIDLFRSASAIHEEQGNFLSWAETKMNIAMTIESQALLSPSDSALELYQRSGKEYRELIAKLTTEESSDLRALAQFNYASTLRNHALVFKGEKAKELFSKCVEQFRLSTIVRSKRDFPAAWAGAKAEIARVYILMAETLGGAAIETQKFRDAAAAEISECREVAVSLGSPRLMSRILDMEKTLKEQ